MQNEVIDEAKSKKKACLVFKVDYEKAYDSVNWNFLLYMLHRLGFCDKWIGWIRGCLQSATISVLVNGSPTEEFPMQRGLRQGDPLAPFLFLMVAEGLNGMMRQAIRRNLFNGFKIGSEGVDVSLLQFADDTLFMGEPSTQNVLVMKSMLRCFELMSGLKVNFFKSKLGGVSLNMTELHRFATILNCSTMVIPFTYLGIPIGANPRRIATWEPLLSKLKKRLASWKSKTLSFGGKLCLIKSVLSSMPLFLLSFYKMPKGVAYLCKKLQKQFLWGNEEGVRKVAWVKWE